MVGAVWLTGRALLPHDDVVNLRTGAIRRRRLSARARRDNVEGHPFHSANNVNWIGITSIVDYQVLPLDRRLLALQEAYVRKVVDTVHDRPVKAAGPSLSRPPSCGSGASGAHCLSIRGQRLNPSGPWRPASTARFHQHVLAGARSGSWTSPRTTSNGTGTPATSNLRLRRGDVPQRT